MLDYLYFIFYSVRHLFGEAEFWIAVLFCLLLYVAWRPTGKALAVAMSVRADKIRRRFAESSSLRKEALLLMTRAKGKLSSAQSDALALVKEARAAAEEARAAAEARLAAEEAEAEARATGAMRAASSELAQRLGREMTGAVLDAARLLLTAEPQAKTNAEAYKNMLSILRNKAA
ncbi:hypothetical protein FACS1894186_4070 [Alphaproteobacteria bacterium]|nr:hypothetical protein FACS1894186_4070 [Alphaproteobacteria bacterium]